MSFWQRDVTAAQRDVEAARGHEAINLLVRDCTLLNLYSEAFEPADISVRDGMIVAIRTGWDGKATQVIDGRGLLALPGLIAPCCLKGIGTLTDARRHLAAGTTTAIVEKGVDSAPIRGVDVELLSTGGFAVPSGSELAEAILSPGEPRSDRPPCCCFTSDDVRRRLRAGLPIFLAGAEDEAGFTALLTNLVTERVDLDRICFAEPDGATLIAAIRAGIRPAKAVSMASLNIAAHFGLEFVLGSIAPGRRADLLLLEAIDRFPPRFVIADGRIEAKNGRLTSAVPTL